MKRIQKLSQEVINKIAAGEVIQRPSNALKELIENSLDAGATTITVTVRDGGLKLLQIQDNGHGIKLEDLDIVCERFTTSKLSTFEDLRKINTFGFRGEALCSISHVSHLSILTKTADSQCAYKAFYSNGKLVPANSMETNCEPKPCAGVVGTLIKAEDLFYSVPSRKKVFKNPQDEHQRIVALMRKYSINNSSIQFILKKQGETTPDVHTPGGQSETQMISSLYGQDLAKELKEIEIQSEKLEFQMKGWFSSLNYQSKKTIFILFINNRLVDSKSLKTSFDQIYSKYLPKGSHPFIFLRLMISPKNIDVNIHPTKSEVKFLYEDQIVDLIQKSLDSHLSVSQQSKTFSTQSIIPDFSNNIPQPTSSQLKKKSNNNNQNNNNSNNNNSNNNNSQIEYDKDKVRTDSKSQTINSFLNPQNNNNNDNNNDIDILDDNKNIDNENDEMNIDKLITTVKTEKQINNSKTFIQARKVKKYKPSELTSIKHLIGTFENDHHVGLKEFFGDVVFVGCLDHCYSLAQCKTKLYLINMETLSRELFYQLTLKGFSDFDQIRFATPLNVLDLLLISLESPVSGWLPTDGPKEKIAQFLSNLIISKSELLLEYFSIEISSDGNLMALPQILENYVPCMDNLPNFLLRLATEVEWEFESDCLEGICREISNFYQLTPTILDKNQIGQSIPNLIGKINNVDDNINLIKRDGKEWVIQHLIFPSFRNLYPPKKLSNDGTVIQITSLEMLYKVFERC
ncbi:MutL DNA mismatch repair protein [Tieghemostelium lacteum]|uniref:MutL DNA mismatch repair protein n=1 Tax=Tieghemostelium lacteum TaxID=361077 RepID=A0A151ZBZ7_TIELA|nr:MutL DNA mismatch repair protein [Tieghemostelium lacteum]|eukprot:KYQ91477.1 MutL DNA mismatch repair protein [Tieghemostelium lacteum]